MHNLLDKALTFAAASGLTPLNVCIAAVVLAAFWWFNDSLGKVFQSAEGFSRMLDRHRGVVVVLVALVPLTARLLLLPSHPIPEPSIHDEFSYLLAADTFAHGKVTNPPHPLFQFFETYHVLPGPTYMSKYPPVQGLLLAAGQVLFGHPWWGEFLSIGLMIGALCWMLFGWLPAPWAVLGSLAAGLQFGIGHAWMNSYWGGAPAAIGACLVLGAFPRLKDARALNGALFGLGIAILLNSRPWEGVAIFLPVTIVALLWVFLSEKRMERVRFALVPAAAVLIVAAASMLYYNWRVTGSALSMPYTTVHKIYSVSPLFVWQTRTPDPTYRHAVMKRYYLQSEPQYQDADKMSTLRGWMSVEPSRLRMAKDVLFGNFFLFICLIALFFDREKPLRVLWFTLALFMVALALESWNQIHYFGPAIGVAAVLKLATLDRLSGFSWQGKRIGLAIATAVVICAAIRLTEASLVFPETDPFPHQRAGIQRDLESLPGPHIVLVRYSETHPPSEEWVYNRANIDASKIVWAREMSEQENRKLFDYFKGRNFWLLQPDTASPKLQPLHVAEQSALGSASSSTGRTKWE